MCAKFWAGVWLREQNIHELREMLRSDLDFTVRVRFEMFQQSGALGCDECTQEEFVEEIKLLFGEEFWDSCMMEARLLRQP